QGVVERSTPRLEFGAYFYQFGDERKLFRCETGGLREGGTRTMQLAGDIVPANGDTLTSGPQLLQFPDHARLLSFRFGEMVLRGLPGLLVSEEIVCLCDQGREVLPVGHRGADGC